MSSPTGRTASRNSRRSRPRSAWISCSRFGSGAFAMSSSLAYDTEKEEQTSQADMQAIQDVRPIPRISIQAFCETEAVAVPIERAGKDRRMEKSHLRVHMGGIP